MKNRRQPLTSIWKGICMARIVDVSLLRKIKRRGAGKTLDVSACFNCGNCTAV